MFDYFKKNNNTPDEQPNDFLNIENSAFNMESDSQSFSDNPNYQSLVYQEPVYDVPKYKAKRLNNIDIVIDSSAVGFDRNALNPNISTVEKPSYNDDEKQVIEEKKIVESIPEQQPLEVLEIVDVVENETNQDNNITMSQNNDENPSGNKATFTSKEDESDKFSIFGSSDGLTNINNYSNENQYKEEKKELIKEVQYTKDGYKICPNCGAILNPTAPVCFMCSKSFVLKR